MELRLTKGLARNIYCLLWLGAFLLFFIGLGQGSLLVWDESLTAVRSLNMFRNGLSFTVMVDSIPDFNKPPLYYWLSACWMYVFGESLLAIRLTSAILGLASLYFVYKVTEKVTGSQWLGFFAFACLLFNSHWLNVARIGMLETSVSLSMLGAIWFGGYSQISSSWKGAFLAGIFLSFGALCKYPLVVWVLIPLYYHWKFILHVESPNKCLLLSLAVFIVCGLSWCLIEYFFWGDIFYNFFFEYNLVERSISGVEGHRNSFFFYLPALLRYAPAQTFLLYFSYIIFIWDKSQRERKYFLILSVTFLFFIAMCLIVSKRRIYLAAWYPFLAICAAFGIEALSKCVSAVKLKITKKHLLFCILLLTLGLVLFFIHFFANFRLYPDYSRLVTSACRELKKDIAHGDYIFSWIENSAVAYFELGTSIIPINGISYAGFLKKLGELPEGRSFWVITDSLRVEKKREKCPLALSLEEVETGKKEARLQVKMHLQNEDVQVFKITLREKSKP